MVRCSAATWRWSAGNGQASVPPGRLGGRRQGGGASSSAQGSQPGRAWGLLLAAPAWVRDVHEDCRLQHDMQGGGDAMTSTTTRLPGWRRGPRSADRRRCRPAARRLSTALLGCPGLPARRRGKLAAVLGQGQPHGRWSSPARGRPQRCLPAKSPLRRRCVVRAGPILVLRVDSGKYEGVIAK
jgi:hypothetical protein